MKSHLNIHSPLFSTNPHKHHVMYIHKLLVCLLPHRLVVGSSPVDVEALQQLMRDDEGLSLGIAGNTYPLSILLGRLAPVPISKGRIALIQQVTHQLGQKWLMERGM